MLLSEGVVRISFRQEAFQVRFQEPFRLVFFVTLLMCEIFFLHTGSDSLLIPLVLCPAAAWVFCAASVLFLSWRYQFHVGPDGIDSYDLWCRQQRTDWKSVTGYRHVNFLGVEYLLVNSTQVRPIWVPLFVERYDLLRDLLVCYSNPALKLDDILPEA